MRIFRFPAPGRLSGFVLFLIVLFATLLAAPAASAAEAKPAGRDGGVNVMLAVAGAALLAGGGAFAYHQDREADRDMRIYRRSAFTANTAAYRERVEEHQRLSWAGLAGAALGGIFLVVAF